MEYLVRVAFGQAANATDPTYTDISAKARIGRGSWSAQRGAEVEQASATASTSGRMVLYLDNADHQHTTGQSMPVTAGLQVQVLAICDGYTVPILEGWTGEPEQPDWTENDGANIIVVPVHDRIGWMSKGQALDSLLTEHIRAVGGARLVGYWTMGEAAEPVGVSSIRGMPDFAVGSGGDRWFVGLPPSPLLLPAGADAAPGDELSPALFQPHEVFDGSFWRQISAYQTATFSPALQVPSGSVLTIMYWSRVARGKAYSPNPVVFSDAASGISYFVRHQTADSIPYSGVNLLALDASWEHQISTRMQFDGDLTLTRIQLRPGQDPTFRVLNAVGTGATASGSPPATLQLDDLILGSDVFGSIWHVQLYITTEADAPTDAEYAEQMEIGFLGHAGQSADDRVRTVAALAGIPQGDLDLDACSARMQILRTKDRLPLDLMQTASDTEQGRFFAAKDRRLTLHARRRRYIPSDH